MGKEKRRIHWPLAIITRAGSKQEEKQTQLFGGIRVIPFVLETLLLLLQLRRKNMG